MDATTLTPVEQAGEIEDEKTITDEKLGGSFTFRLPYAMDELRVLRRRAQIVGISEDLAGVELVAVAHARAMFETYCIQNPRAFRIDPDANGKGGLRTWGRFLKMMTEVRDWHDTFREAMDPEEEQDSGSES